MKEGELEKKSKRFAPLTSSEDQKGIGDTDKEIYRKYPFMYSLISLFDRRGAIGIMHYLTKKSQYNQNKN